MANEFATGDAPPHRRHRDLGRPVHHRPAGLGHPVSPTMLAVPALCDPVATYTLGALVIDASGWIWQSTQPANMATSPITPPHGSSISGRSPRTISIQTPPTRRPMTRASSSTISSATGLTRSTSHCSLAASLRVRWRARGGAPVPPARFLPGSTQESAMCSINPARGGVRCRHGGQSGQSIERL